MLTFPCSPCRRTPKQSVERGEQPRVGRGRGKARADDFDNADLTTPDLTTPDLTTPGRNLTVTEPLAHNPHSPMSIQGPIQGRVGRVRRPRVLLASRSPRRRALLDEAGIAHDITHPGFEDGVLVPGNVQPAQWVASLAYLKAWAGAASEAARAGGGVVVLGADTACLMDDRLIGTPSSEAEAREIIRAFANRDHEVLTGVALLDLRGYDGLLEVLPAERRRMLVDRARVRVGEIHEDEVERYLRTGDWQGKAGAYNLSERLAAGWPIQFEGDHTTIMGLPMRALLRALDGMSE
jgi:septum formation protein